MRPAISDCLSTIWTARPSEVCHAMWQCCESALEQVLDRDESYCTYHHPGTRVVSLESKRQPAVGRQHGGVSAGGVVVVEGVDVALPPGLLTGTEDVEVVAVKVNRMGKGWVGAVLLDNPILPLGPLLIATR